MRFVTQFQQMRECFASICIIVLLAFYTLIDANSAKATPPHYVNIFDIPIAVNHSHLFLFRNLSDNEGSHFTRNTHRFLIAQNLITGVVDSHWLVEITDENFLPEVCGKDCVLRQFSSSEGIFGVLSDRKAFPLSYFTVFSGAFEEKFPNKRDEYFLSDTGLMRYREDSVSALGSKEVYERISASLNPTMREMNAGFEEGNQIYFVEAAYQKTLAGCLVEELDSNIPKQVLFQLICEDEGDRLVNRFRIFFTIAESKIPAERDQ